MPVVYRHTSPSGKSYVGWTDRPAVRWSQHVHEAVSGRSNAPFHRAIRKYGPQAFTHEVLEIMTTTAGAQRAEQLWIARLGTFGSTGYNATRGGEGTPGCVPSVETRARQSAARAGRRPAMAGRKHSAETIARMRAAHTGRPHPRRGVPCSPETRAKIAAAKFGKSRRKAGA